MWRWWRVRAPDEGLAQARADQARRRAAIEARTGPVREVASSLRGMREENHWRERIVAALRGEVG